MPATKALPIDLSPDHDRQLKALVRAHSTPQKLAERARIILLASEGWGVSETAEELGIWRKTAGHWRRRWLAAAAATSVPERSSDAPRCGAPATFTPERICQIMALACEEPPVTREHDGQQNVGVEVGGSQQPQFGEHGGLHLLGHIDHHNRPAQRALDVRPPALVQDLGTAVAVMRRRSSRLPDLPPGREFRGADPVAGKIAFVQAYELGFGLSAAVRIRA